MANIVEVREMSNEQLEEIIENNREEMFNLRFKHSASQISDPMRIRYVRREIAQLKSVLQNRSLAISAAAAQPEIAKALEGKEWDATANYVYEDSAYAVNFQADGGDVATAMVNLNKKRPKSRRSRTIGASDLVKSFELK